MLIPRISESEESDHHDHSEKSQFLRQNRKDKVVMRLRQRHILLPALSESDAEKASPEPIAYSD